MTFVARLSLALALPALGACERGPTKGLAEERTGAVGLALTPSAPLECVVAGDATGASDATAAFAAAFDCATKNQRLPVRVPPGTYRVTKSLVVPEAVALVGEPSAALGAPGPSGASARPVLRFPAGFADDAVVLSDRASLSGVEVSFEGPQPAPNAAVRVEGIGIGIAHVRLVNAGIGVHAPPSVNSGRLYVNDVEIVDAATGLYADYALDCSRFENVRVSRSKKAPGTYGLVFGRNDYMMTSKLVVTGLAVGVEFRNTITKDGEGTLGSLAGLEARGCDLGLSVTGGARVAASGLTVAAEESAVSVRDTAELTLAGSQLASVANNAVFVGDDATLTLSGSTIDRSSASSGNHGVGVGGGRFVTITGNRVLSHGHGVFFFSSPKRGVVAGNTFELTNPSGRGVFGAISADVVVAANGANQ